MAPGYHLGDLPMSISVKCPNCRALVEGGDDLAGKTAKCPKCSVFITLPSKAKPYHYIIAIVAILAEVLLFALTVAFLGLQHGGGLIPMIILMVVLGVTWRAITKQDSFLSDFVDDLLGRN